MTAQEPGVDALAGRDPHDVDGVADHVPGAALAFGALGALLASSELVLNVTLQLREEAF
jgi:hypothetical protein